MFKKTVGDLFTVDPSFSLAHCVSLDYAMGAGIAKIFRSKFVKAPGDLEELRAQSKISIEQIGQDSCGTVLLSTRCCCFVVTRTRHRRLLVSEQRGPLHFLLGHQEVLLRQASLLGPREELDQAARTVRKAWRQVFGHASNRRWTGQTRMECGGEHHQPSVCRLGNRHGHLRAQSRGQLGQTEAVRLASY